MERSSRNYSIRFESRRTFFEGFAHKNFVGGRFAAHLRRFQIFGGSALQSAGNAAKYAPPKTIIEISARKSDNETVEFAVTDEGTGVAEDLREKIFDKFFRLTDLSNGEYAPSGTGLGLAIAKGIIEAHGGKIFVTDGANKTGAKFIFTIPIGDE